MHKGLEKKGSNNIEWTMTVKGYELFRFLPISILMYPEGSADAGCVNERDEGGRTLQTSSKVKLSVRTPPSLPPSPFYHYFLPNRSANTKLESSHKETEVNYVNLFKLSMEMFAQN